MNINTDLLKLFVCYQAGYNKVFVANCAIGAVQYSLTMCKIMDFFAIWQPDYQGMISDNGLRNFLFLLPPELMSEGLKTLLLLCTSFIKFSSTMS